MEKILCFFLVLVMPFCIHGHQDTACNAVDSTEQFKLWPNSWKLWTCEDFKFPRYNSHLHNICQNTLQAKYKCPLACRRDITDVDSSTLELELTPIVRCNNWHKKYCTKSTEPDFSSKCPNLCDKCSIEDRDIPPGCIDSTEEFSSKGSTFTCPDLKLIRNKWRCNQKFYFEKCPVTCNKCPCHDTENKFAVQLTETSTCSFFQNPNNKWKCNQRISPGSTKKWRELCQISCEFCPYPEWITFPPLERKHKGCSFQDPCENCQSNCQNDNECKEGLRCMERNNLSHHVPGCQRGSFLDGYNVNYCRYNLCSVFIYSKDSFI